MKSLSVLGPIFFLPLFCYLAYQEGSVWPRGSWASTTQTHEYVHERYQRSYFRTQDAQKLRRLHNEEALALLGIVACVVVAAYSRRKSRGR